MNDEIKIKTNHWPEAKGEFADYWLAWANGVQSDGETEQEAIENAKQALANGCLVDPAYVP
ncbi:hypothetical protein [Janthinobacterium sp. MDT1-19]|uniref:hypothetical protein n=1 Tax=Janthinobacterium sp. MDT1-19 TaxID=1259339 RepID=UPI003F25B000